MITDELPNSSVKLGDEWALQHPQDYIDVLKTSIPKVLKNSRVSVDKIVGLGIDFTACTMLPVDDNNVPLAFDKELKERPNAWVKLWKHHAAQAKANQLNHIAEKRNEKFLSRYGGKISSEWMIAKAWQILDEDPELYRKADKLVEATDWVVSELTGNLVRNSCTAGYKSIWHKQEGYPDENFFKALDPRLQDIADTKLRGEVVPLGTKAGGLTEEMAALTGLPIDCLLR